LGGGGWYEFIRHWDSIAAAGVKFGGHREILFAKINEN